MKKIIKILCIFLYLIVCFVSINVVSVFAEEEVEYTNVLDDLSKDDSFDSTKYPSIDPNDVKESLNNDVDSDDIKFFEVIGLAEGYNNELYIYVYNPTRSENFSYNATSILLYSSENANPKTFTPIEFNLKLLSTSFTLDKYLVEDFKISSESNRYYNLVEINRPFIENFDNKSENSEINDISIGIGQQWHCYYYNNELIYECGYLETLRLEITYHGSLFFENGFQLKNLLLCKSKRMMSYFVSFNCENYVIEHIYDADVKFNILYCEEYEVFDDDEITSIPNGTILYPNGETPIPKDLTLNDTDTVTFDGKGLFSKTYNWNRISSSKDFISNFEKQGGVFAEECKTVLNNSEWVFAYFETEHELLEVYDHTEYMNIEHYNLHKYNKVSSFDILRISFIDINGKYYNLGVVADKTTADSIVDGVAKPIDYTELLEMILMVLGFVILVLIIVACGPFISVFFNILSVLFKFIVKIIIFPLNLLPKLFKKNKR